MQRSPSHCSRRLVPGKPLLLEEELAEGRSVVVKRGGEKEKNLWGNKRENGESCQIIEVSRLYSSRLFSFLYGLLGFFGLGSGVIL